MSMYVQEMTMQEATHPLPVDPNFHCAPLDWSVKDAEDCAREEGLILNDDHWEVIRILQECLACAEHPRGRRLHDILGEKFQTRGGLRYLYELFPSGPVAQGCRMAGLVPPVGAVDKSFGSVQ
ncbi:Sulfurtransferase [Gammaproteobacteria bacterium]